MTYIELIVVLGIFSMMSSVVIFNYEKFQAKVDIKNLANDIALKIVEAQKSSLSGKLPVAAYGANWKPSYGVYFGLTNPGNNKTFIYFTDLDQSGDFVDPQFCSTPGSGECLEKISITKGNYISELKVFFQDSNLTPTVINDLSIDFTRPNSGPTLRSSSTFSGPVSYIQITAFSPQSVSAKIKIYSSGRVQIN